MKDLRCCREYDTIVVTYPSYEWCPCKFARDAHGKMTNDIKLDSVARGQLVVVDMMNHDIEYGN